jgi:signal transduction histidine kinase
LLPKNIEFKIASGMPCLYGNFYRFRQLFQNLIENAVKYNDKEKGYIEVGCEDKGDFIEFYIKDNGKGIPKAYFEKIFNVFTKLESNTHSSGIGLSIVKKIISFYGGSVWLESTENEGTTFFFTLPKNHGTA